MSNDIALSSVKQSWNGFLNRTIKNINSQKTISQHNMYISINEFLFNKKKKLNFYTIFNDLLEMPFLEEETEFLRQLKSKSLSTVLPGGRVVEPIYTEEESKLGISLFFTYSIFKTFIENIKRELENNSILRNKLSAPIVKLEGNLDYFKNNYLFKKKESSFDYCFHFIASEYSFKQVVKQLNEFQHVKQKMTAAIQVDYPQSYKNITQSNSQDDVIKNIFLLFADYKWSLWHPFRKNEKKAQEICKELKKIIEDKEKKNQKIESAINVIQCIKMSVANARKVRFYDEHQSSFFRRANFALKLLDSKKVENVKGRSSP